VPKRNPSPAKTPAKAAGTVRAKTPTQVPGTSLSKAQTAFRNFSLSRFPDASSAPSSLVGSGQQVSAVQRQSQINHLKSLDASGRKLRIALSDSELKQYLPSYDGKTVVLQELMDVIQEKMRGTEFYVAGNPTFVRLAVQSQAADIIQTIKSGSNGNKPE